MPTCVSISIARSRAAARDTPWWIRTASTSWSPILKNGCSDESGSWKIIAISLPRTARSSAGDMLSRSLPSNIARPEISVVRDRVSPSSVSELTLLPEPDSPTIPSTLPLSSS
jgi:hypothetical protein